MRQKFLHAAVVILSMGAALAFAQTKEPDNGPELAEALRDKFGLQCYLRDQKYIWNVGFEKIDPADVPEALDEVIRIPTVSMIKFRDMTVTSEMLKKLRTASSLKYLVVMNAGVRDKDLGTIEELTKLKTLDLTGNPISDAALKHLEPLTQLKWLYLNQTGINGSGFKHLLPLRKLQYLSLQGTRITNESMIVLGKIDSLHHLTMNNTSITADGINDLSGLFRLHTLEVDVQVTDDFRKQHAVSRARAKEAGLLRRNHIPLNVKVRQKPQEPKQAPRQPFIT